MTVLSPLRTMDCKNGSAEYECTYNKYIIIYKSFLHSCNVGYSAMEEIKENQPIPSPFQVSFFHAFTYLMKN